MLRNDQDGVALCIIYDGFLIEVMGLDVGLLLYSLRPKHRRQGLSTEVARMMFDCGFKMFDMSCILENVFSDNLASVRVPKKLVVYSTNHQGLGHWKQVLWWFNGNSCYCVRNGSKESPWISIWCAGRYAPLP